MAEWLHFTSLQSQAKSTCEEKVNLEKPKPGVLKMMLVVYLTQGPEIQQGPVFLDFSKYLSTVSLVIIQIIYTLNQQSRNLYFVFPGLFDSVY